MREIDLLFRLQLSLSEQGDVEELADDANLETEVCEIVLYTVTTCQRTKWPSFTLVCLSYEPLNVHTLLPPCSLMR